MKFLSHLFLCCFGVISFQTMDAINPALKSWITSANESFNDFPIQNLPYGVFKKGNSIRIGVAIGSDILDMKGCLEANLLDHLDQQCKYAFRQKSLNALMKLDKNKQEAIRNCIKDLLVEGSIAIAGDEKLRRKLIIPQKSVQLVLPFEVGDYTDFYASIHHATHVGSLMRPENPLMPNYKHMPIGYHGRASSIVVSGTNIVWPFGQFLNKDGVPVWNQSQALDYELELGAVIGKGNPLGDSISINDASEHIFGYVLLNDWSARDIQKWEYQPLGPFNGKNFATTISPWVVTSEALSSYSIPREVRHKDDPPLLDYLKPNEHTALNIIVETYILSDLMKRDNIEPLLICHTSFSDMYWTFDQMISQHTSSGCNLRTGDLLGSGTISGLESNALGCLLERKALKLGPLQLPDGTSREYLEDGDAVILKAYAQREGYPRIGFGECRGVVFKNP